MFFYFSHSAAPLCFCLQAGHVEKNVNKNIATPPRLKKKLSLQR